MKSNDIIMNKARLKPMPNAIVSCRTKDGKDNALVIGVASNVSLDPLMLMIGIIPSRYSYDIVKETGVFVVNIPAKGFEKEFEFLGTESGRDYDKFKELDLKYVDGEEVNAAILTDCPVNFECKVIDSLKPGTHDLFIGKVEKVHCDEEYLEDGLIQWDKIDLL